MKGGAISLGPRSILEAADRPRGGLETAAPCLRHCVRTAVPFQKKFVRAQYLRLG